MYSKTFKSLDFDPAGIWVQFVTFKKFVPT